jgi:hypothetical protein
MKKYKDNIFAVEVPLWSTQHELYDISDYTVIKYPAPFGWGKIKIFKTEYKIIGSLTQDFIDFDVRPYLQTRIVEGPPSYNVYRLSNHFGDWPYTENADQAFRSSLYWFYFPTDAPENPDDWPTEIPVIKEKLLLLQMVNLTPENW